MRVERSSVAVVPRPGLHWIVRALGIASRPRDRFAARPTAKLLQRLSKDLAVRLKSFAVIFLPLTLIIGGILLVIGARFGTASSGATNAIAATLWTAYWALTVICAAAVWFLVL